jgi:hypothetical protein
MTENLSRAVAALSDLVDPAATQQLIAKYLSGDMVFTEESCPRPFPSVQ